MNWVRPLSGEGENVLWLGETELILGSHSDLVDRGLLQPCEVVFAMISLSVLMSFQVRSFSNYIKDSPVLLSKFAKTENKL